jgi:hypothetical protein
MTPTATIHESASQNPATGEIFAHLDAGPPVLLLAGLGGVGRSWGPQVDLLLHACYRVILSGHRGTGQSGRPPGGYTIAQHAADMAGLLESLTAARPISSAVQRGERSRRSWPSNTPRSRAPLFWRHPLPVRTGIIAASSTCAGRCCATAVSQQVLPPTPCSCSRLCLRATPGCRRVLG